MAQSDIWLNEQTIKKLFKKVLPVIIKIHCLQTESGLKSVFTGNTGYGITDNAIPSHIVSSINYATACDAHMAGHPKESTDVHLIMFAVNQAPPFGLAEHSTGTTTITTVVVPVVMVAGIHFMRA